MSVINQVLKELDRQGANTSAPAGVIAVSQREPAAPPRSRWLLVGLISAALAAFWWFSPLARLPAPSPKPEAHPAKVVPEQAVPRLEHAPPQVGAAQSAPLPLTKPVAKPDSLVDAQAATHPKPKAVVSATRNNTPQADARPPESRPTKPAAAEPPGNKAMVKAMPSDASQARTPQMQAEEAWRQANRLIEQGRNHDAQEQLENLLRLEPGHVAGRQRLIGLMLQTENATRAESLLREGSALSPNEAWYPRSLAQLQLQRGDTAQAAATLQIALAKHPDASNWALYASTATKLAQPADAAQAYREALQLNPAQGNWWIGLAVALEQSGEKSGAGEAYQRALQTRLSSELRDYAQQKTRELNGR